MTSVAGSVPFNYTDILFEPEVKAFWDSKVSPWSRCMAAAGWLSPETWAELDLGRELSFRAPVSLFSSAASGGSSNLWITRSVCKCHSPPVVRLQRLSLLIAFTVVGPPKPSQCLCPRPGLLMVWF